MCEHEDRQPRLSKTESLNENEINSTREKSEVTTTILSGVEDFSSALITNSCSTISTYSQTKGCTNASSGTNCTSPVLSPCDSSSSLTYDASEKEEPDSDSASTESRESSSNLQITEQNKTSVGDMCENKDGQPCASKTESVNENGTDSSREKSELTKTMLSGVEDFSSALITNPCSMISTYPQTKGCTNASSETNCTSPVLSPCDSSSSLTYNPSGKEEPDSDSASTESSSNLQITEQNKTSVGDMCENKDGQPCASKTESVNENGTDSSREKSELTKTMLSGVEDFSSALITNPCSTISTYSQTKGCTNASSETNCTSPVLSPCDSSSSLTYNPSEKEEPDSDSASTESSSNLQITEQNKTSVGDMCENKDGQPCASKTESVNQNGIDSSREKSELTTTVLSGVEDFSSALITDPCSAISTYSETEGCTNASNETNCTSPVLSPCDSSSSLTYKPSEIKEQDSVSMESSSALDSQVFSVKETSFETSAYSETPLDFSIPGEEVCEPDIQACERLENTFELHTNSPTPAERHQWVLMNRKYIQKEGYRLGIRPGTFYSSNKGYFVEVPNGVNYEIILTNENPVPCNVDVFIDNNKKPDICFILRPDKPLMFDGPTFCKNKFVFLRSEDAPLQSGISSANTGNGMVEAVFTPQKVENVKRRTTSEPVPFSRRLSNVLQMLGTGTETQKLRSYTTSSADAERSIDLTNFCQGATALRGEQAPKSFKRAESMETDETRRVIMRLRLIARNDDPRVPSEEDICSLRPPSVAELLQS